MNVEQRQALQTFFRQFMAAISNIHLYSGDHPQVQHLLEFALESFETAIGMEHNLSIMAIDDELIMDGSPLPSSIYLSRLTQLLTERGVGHLKMTQGMTRDELQAFAVRLSRPIDTVKEGMRSSPHIILGRTELKQGFSEGEGPLEHPLTEEEAFEKMADLSGEELTRFMDLYDAVKHRRKFNMSAITELVSDFVKVFAYDSDPLIALAPLRAMDEYTFTHSTNVCILNLAQATSLGIKGPVLHDIGIAGMLHDIGKLFIPDEVINKPGKLSQEEWDLICEHPVRGAQYLLDSPGIPQLAVITAFEHHMRYDLQGYPKVAADWRLNLCSQLTMISDMFDAIRTSRSYSEAAGHDYAITILAQQAGKGLNPSLVKNFAQVMRKMPPTALKEATEPVK